MTYLVEHETAAHGGWEKLPILDRDTVTVNIDRVKQ